MAGGFLAWLVMGAGIGMMNTNDFLSADWWLFTIGAFIVTVTVCTIIERTNSKKPERVV